MKYFTSAIIPALLITSVQSIQAAQIQLPTEPIMTVEYAEQLAKLARKICEAQQVSASISVVNQQGSLMYFLRADNSGPHSIKTSFRKAYTAASLQTDTKNLTLAVDQAGYSQLGKMADDILLLTGGVTVRYKGNVIGGIGLSGAPNPIIEEKCALDALAGME